MNTALNRTGIAILTNKSGGSVAQGDVVIIDSANAAAFTTTTVSGYVSGSIGVVLEPNGIASNAIGAVAFSGYVPLVNLSSSASLGDVFHAHSVAKQALRHAAPIVAGDFGQVWGTGTTPPALLWAQPAATTSATAGPAGKLGYAQITANVSTTSPSFVDVTGLDVTVTIGTRPIKITVYSGQVSNLTAGNRTIFQIIDVTNAGAQVQNGVITESGTNSNGYALSMIVANLTPAAGSREYKVQFKSSSGTSSTVAASSTTPAFILVEEI